MSLFIGFCFLIYALRVYIQTDKPIEIATIELKNDTKGNEFAHRIVLKETLILIDNAFYISPSNLKNVLDLTITEDNDYVVIRSDKKQNETVLTISKNHSFYNIKDISKEKTIIEKSDVPFVKTIDERSYYAFSKIASIFGFQVTFDKEQEHLLVNEFPSPFKKEDANEISGDFRSFNEMEFAVFIETNRQRTLFGLPKLVLSEELSRVAREKSKNMHDKEYFSHNSPDLGSAFDMLEKAQVYYQKAGENLAAGHKTAEKVVDSWMHSTEGHREAILDNEFIYIGVGFVEGNKNYKTYFTQIFLK